MCHEPADANDHPVRADLLGADAGRADFGGEPVIAAPLWLPAAWRFLRAIPPIVYVGILALVFALASGHYRHQRDEARKETKAVKADFKAHVQADRDLAAKAKADAEADRQKRQAEAAAAWAVREQEFADASEAKERTIADLRSGALRLRKQWQGCQARSDSGNQADQGAGGGDENADLRAKDSGDLVRFGHEADAEITYLQGLIRSAPACFVVEP